MTSIPFFCPPGVIAKKYYSKSENFFALEWKNLVWLHMFHQIWKILCVTAILHLTSILTFLTFTRRTGILNYHPCLGTAAFKLRTGWSVWAGNTNFSLSMLMISLDIPFTREWWPQVQLAVKSAKSFAIFLWLEFASQAVQGPRVTA